MKYESVQIANEEQRVYNNVRESWRISSLAIQGREDQQQHVSMRDQVNHNVVYPIMAQRAVHDCGTVQCGAYVLAWP